MVVTMTQMIIQPHHEKQILHLDSAEGPIPALLWRVMQRVQSHATKPTYSRMHDRRSGWWEW
jgi:hypothetical protein